MGHRISGLRHYVGDVGGRQGAEEARLGVLVAQQQLVGRYNDTAR